MKEKFKQLDVKVKIALIFIFGFFYLYANNFPEKSRQFPQLIASVSLILVIISLIFDFTKEEVPKGELGGVDDAELMILDAEAKKERRRRFYKAWAIILVSAAIGFLGGFLLSTFSFFLGFAFFFGERKKLTKNIIISVLVTAIIYLIFEKIMQVPLLEGLLW